MAFLDVVSRQPSRAASRLSMESRGYSNLSDDGIQPGKAAPLKDFEGRTLTETDMGYTPLRGCDDLQHVTKAFIRQRMQIDLKAGCGAGNTYHILDEKKQVIFKAVEDKNCWCRWCCGPHRFFHITIYNNRDQPVLHLDRSCCRNDWCCCTDCCFCQHSLNIRDWRGEIIGSARQKFHCFQLKMDVVDADDRPFCRIRGPCCVCRCCTEMNFDINSMHGKPLGYYFKRFEGYRDDVNVDHENSELYFPKGMSLAQKATLLGAAFLVEFMYFEMS